MLKNIPAVLSPELFKVMMEMGHGDEIVLGDSNFPAGSSNTNVIRCDGHSIPDLLDAILKFFPLDTFVDNPVSLMEVVPGDDVKPVIWNKYLEIIKRYQNNFSEFKFIERYNFYKRSSEAFAVVATGEMALYGNIILKKGLVT